MVVYHINRIGRTERASFNILYELMNAGLEVHAANRGVVKEGFETSIEIMIAAEERRNIIRQTRAGLFGEARQGLLPYGIHLYGYTNIPRQNKCELEPTQAEVVRRIFREAGEGKTFYNISESLNKDGIPTLRGAKWSSATVSRMVSNPSYKGERSWQLEGKHYKLKIPAIVTPAEWQAAQRKGRGSRPKNNHLLLGHLRCAHCGYSLTAHLRQNRSKPPTWYYACTSLIAQNRERCANRFHRMDALEPKVEAAVRKAFQDERTLVSLLQEAQDEQDTSTLDKLRQAEANLLQTLSSGDISPGEFAELRKALRANITAELNRLNTEAEYPLEEYREAAARLELKELLTYSNIIITVDRDMSLSLSVG